MTTQSPQTGGSWIVAVASPRTIALVWIGMLVGLYAVEFPARFGSTEAHYGAALDIGWRLFERLSTGELLLWGLMAMFAWASRAQTYVWVAIAVAGIVVALQSFWLLPDLTARALAIIGGGTPPASQAHSLYSALEITKGVALLAIAVSADRRAG